MWFAENNKMLYISYNEQLVFIFNVIKQTFPLGFIAFLNLSTCQKLMHFWPFRILGMASRRETKVMRHSDKVRFIAFKHLS